ncbi:MAG: hypothetical protein ACR2RL_24430 [Gammaproteobacteria bacterium]
MKLRWLLTIGVMASSVVLAVPLVQRLSGLAEVSNHGTQPPAKRPVAPSARVEDPVRLPQRPSSAREHKPRRVQQAPSGQAAPGEPTARVTVHRWVDRNGTVHYETAPPPAGVRSQALVFEGRRQPEPTDTVVPGPPALPAPESDTSLADNPYSVYTPEGFEELMQRVDETVKRLGERRETYEKLKQSL